MFKQNKQNVIDMWNELRHDICRYCGGSGRIYHHSEDDIGFKCGWCNGVGYKDKPSSNQRVKTMIKFNFDSKLLSGMIKTLEADLAEFANKYGIIGSIGSKQLDECTYDQVCYLMSFSEENYTVCWAANEILKGNYYAFVTEKVMEF